MIPASQGTDSQQDLAGGLAKGPIPILMTREETRSDLQVLRRYALGHARLLWNVQAAKTIR